MKKASLRLVATLGLTQTIGYASSFYLPAVLARPMAEKIGTSVSTVYALFSVSLIIAALTAPFAGRCIDNWGGKRVLAASSIWFALSLVFLSQAQSVLSFFLGWASLGFAMGAGLYDMAFAAVVRSRGQSAQTIIIGITLIAGFASTIGWPISHYFLANFGLRQALLVWAGVHLFLALPLNLSLVLPMLPGSVKSETSPNQKQKKNNILMVFVLAMAFVCFGFCVNAMAGHMPRLLQLFGVSVAASIAVGTALGPSQIFARLIHLFVLQKQHPINKAILAVLLMPLGAVSLVLFGQNAALAVCITHGFGSGTMFIVKGILPLRIFGEKGYGHRQGLLFLPANIVQALSPFLFSLCIDTWGRGALYIYIVAIWIATLLFLWLKQLVKHDGAESA